MKCFYHGDADGKCAGFWVCLSTGLDDEYSDYSFVEMTYANPFPMDSK